MEDFKRTEAELNGETLEEASDMADCFNVAMSIASETGLLDMVEEFDDVHTILYGSMFLSLVNEMIETGDVVIMEDSAGVSEEGYEVLMEFIDSVKEAIHAE